MVIVPGVQKHAFHRIKTRATCIISKEHSRRAIEFVKDRTENFDDYYPYKKLGCSLNHV
jgi:hypothetical protein